VRFGHARKGTGGASAPPFAFLAVTPQFGQKRQDATHVGTGVHAGVSGASDATWFHANIKGRKEFCGSARPARSVVSVFMFMTKSTLDFF
jgi:hypothetical protein